MELSGLSSWLNARCEGDRVTYVTPSILAYVGKATNWNKEKTKSTIGLGENDGKFQFGVAGY